MKKTMAIILAATMLAASVPGRAFAGDRGWSTAGKIMTGIIGLHILGNVIANSHPQPVYVPETRYYAPAPEPRYYSPPARERVWIGGHYETRIERQWVPGRWEIRHDANERALDDFDDEDSGDRSSRVWISGHYKTVEVRVWVPGHYEDRG